MNWSETNTKIRIVREFNNIEYIIHSISCQEELDEWFLLSCEFGSLELVQKLAVYGENKLTKNY